jgi:hypothetical protein
MNARGFVVLPDQGRVWNMAPGRSAVLKLLSEETAESVMTFEETVPAGWPHALPGCRPCRRSRRLKPTSGSFGCWLCR